MIVESWYWGRGVRMFVTDCVELRDILKKAYGRASATYYRKGIPFMWQFVIPLSRVAFYKRMAEGFAQGRSVMRYDKVSIAQMKHSTGSSGDKVAAEESTHEG